MAPLVELKGIDKRFPGVQALSRVSVSLEAGEIHALLGENGAGKSTLVKVLGGLHRPDGGQVLVGGQPQVIASPAQATALGIAFIHQELNLAQHLTVAENLYLGLPPVRGPLRLIDWAAMRRGARELLARLGAHIDPDARLGDLGVGNRQLVEIARALNLKSRVLIMDEPTAALTEAEAERLFGVVRGLADAGVAVVYISHRLEEIFQLCHRVTVLRDGALVATRRLSEVTPTELITLMVGRQLTERFPKVEVAPGETLLEVEGLSRRGRFAGASFRLCRGEILAVAGLMGAGRSELVQAVAGIDRPSGGTVRLLGHPLPPGDARAAVAAGLCLVPEDRKKQGLLMGRSVRENLALAVLRQLTRAGMISGRRERALAARSIADLGIRTPGPEQDVGLLSGGNQQKVVLGRWLNTEPKVLILDEPTRGIDVGAKAEIYRLMGLLAQRGMGILLVSSELPEVLGLADRILVMHQGRLAGEFSRAEATQERIMRAATGRAADVG